jgi:hypothetical protein
MCWASFECSFKLSIVAIQCQFLLFLFLVSFVNVPTAVLRLELERLNFLVAAQKRLKEKKRFHAHRHTPKSWNRLERVL